MQSFRLYTSEEISQVFSGGENGFVYSRFTNVCDPLMQ